MAEHRCAVCGTTFSLWARFTGDAADQVCHACEEKGLAKLENISGSVARDSTFPDIVARFDAAVMEYRVPLDRASPIRGRLIENIFKATAEKERVSNDDLLYLVDLGNKYKPTSANAEVLRASAGRLNRRVVIDTWDPSDPPAVKCSGLLLQNGEMCHWEKPARLYEQRTRREYVGASHGVSFPLALGIRYRVSAFKGTPIDTTYLSDCGEGTLHVTNKRVCFTGSQQSAAVPWAKVINVAVFSDGFAIHRAGAKKPTVLQVCHTDLTLEILARASPAKND